MSLTVLPVGGNRTAPGVVRDTREPEEAGALVVAGTAMRPYG